MKRDSFGGDWTMGWTSPAKQGGNLEINRLSSRDLRLSRDLRSWEEVFLPCCLALAEIPKSEKLDTEDEETAQQSKELSAISEDPGSVPSTSLRLTTIFNSSSKGLYGHFTHVVHRCTSKQALMHTNIHKYIFWKLKQANKKEWEESRSRPTRLSVVN